MNEEYIYQGIAASIVIGLVVFYLVWVNYDIYFKKSKSKSKDQIDLLLMDWRIDDRVEIDRSSYGNWSTDLIIKSINKDKFIGKLIDSYHDLHYGDLIELRYHSSYVNLSKRRRDINRQNDLLKNKIAENEEFNKEYKELKNKYYLS